MEEQDLVMLRLPNDLSYTGRQRHYNTWFRVVFIDNDGSFVGRLEKKDWDFTLYPVNECVRLQPKQVLHTYKEGEQFCYSDKVTICQCSGLCRNK